MARDAGLSVSAGSWLERRGSVSPGSRFGGSVVNSGPVAVIAPRTMAERFVGLARGGQPCVVKLISYGVSSRMGSLSNYISRDGELALENEWGKTLVGKQSLSGLSGEWDHLLSDRADSRDIGVFRAELELNAALRLDASEVHEKVRDVLSVAYGGRKFAYGIVEGEAGSVRVEGLVMLRHADGSRLTGMPKPMSLSARPTRQARWRGRWQRSFDSQVMVMVLSLAQAVCAGLWRSLVAKFKIRVAS